MVYFKVYSNNKNIPGEPPLNIFPGDVFPKALPDPKEAGAQKDAEPPKALVGLLLKLPKPVGVPPNLKVNENIKSSRLEVT